MLGKRLDHYRILELLGRGGMGEVYLAEDERLGRKVAIKLLAETLLEDREALQRFQTEARAVAELSHPHIATLHDLGEAEGRPYLVMEYVEGPTLAEHVREGPLPLEEALRLGLAVAEGLAHAHGHGVVHRDVKTDNVMLGPEGAVKILDFGLARLEDRTRVTRAGVRMGTLRAMSPEQLRGEDVDARTDVWALGVLFHEMIVGRAPFERESSEATAQAILSQPASPLSAQRTGVDLALDRIVLKCLEKDFARRYPHVSDLVVDLRGLMRQSESGEAPIVSARPTRRRNRWLSVGVPLGLALIALAVTLLIQPKEGVPFAERDWVLLADFKSLSADAELEQALQAGLEVSLQQSRYVNVFPRNQVQETLQRMEVEGNARIDVELGREIALRESIKILVACSISQVGNEFSLMARLIEPETGTALHTEEVRASGRSDILDALDDLAARIRSELGESLTNISHQRIPLPRATTSSLEALEYFAAGEIASGERRFQAAHRAFEEAVAADSTFALAHARLGSSYYWKGLGPRGERHFQRALELEHRLTYRERLFLPPYIAGWRGNREKAIDGYRTYLEAYPDDSAAWFQLGYQFTRLARCDEAREAFGHVLDLRPRNAAAHVNIATCFGNDGRREEALTHYREAFELRPEWRLSGNLNHEYGFVLAAAGRLDEAEANFREMLDEDDASRARGHRSLGLLEMLRGRYRSAEDHLEEAIRLHRSMDHWLSAARDRLFLASVHRRLGREEAETRQLAEVRETFQAEYPGARWVVYLGAALRRAGDAEGVRSMLVLMEERQTAEVRHDRAALQRLRGELLLAQDDPDAAIEALRLAHATTGESPDAAALATAYFRAGELEDARRFWTIVSEEPTRGWEAQEPWLESHYWLGRIAEAQDDPATAIRWYDTLLKLWEEADETALLQDTRRRLQRNEAIVGG